MDSRQRILLDYEDRRAMLVQATQQGVTLVELLVGIAIVGILLAVGIPSFTGWIQNTQVRTAAESMLTGLQLARAEAVRRNDLVRFTLTDPAGLTAWNVGCVNVTATCPAMIQNRNANEGSVNARAGVSFSAAQNYAVAIAAGTNMTGVEGVTFNGLGRVPTANIGTDITRIDLSNAVSTDVRKLIIAVSPGGQVRLCDAALNANDTQGC